MFQEPCTDTNIIFRAGRVPLSGRVIESAHMRTTKIVAALSIDEVVDVTVWLWVEALAEIIDFLGVRGLLRRGGSAPVRAVALSWRLGGAGRFF